MQKRWRFTPIDSSGVLVMRRVCPGVVVAASLTLSIGCGRSHPPPVVPVSGRITLDGNPLVNADVGFSPTADAKFPFSYARTDQQGRYTLHLGQETDAEGAVVGEHRVLVSVDPKLVKVSPLPKSKAAMRSRSQFTEATAAKFGKFLEKFTVPANGTTDANFDLKSK
jgi:hypothetical protein